LMSKLTHSRALINLGMSKFMPHILHFITHNLLEDIPPESQEVSAGRFLDCRKVLRPFAGFALNIGLNALEAFKLNS